MKSAKPTLSHEPKDRNSTAWTSSDGRGRAAYRQRIRAVGVEAIAEGAGINKMTPYRHFGQRTSRWRNNCGRPHARPAAAGTPASGPIRVSRLRRSGLGLPNGPSPCQFRQARVCALANAAVEPPDKAHAGPRVIEGIRSHSANA
jgi:hypothetical protein